MLFNSLTFLVFFACVLALYAVIPSWRSRKALLLAASYLFYAAWHLPYVLILGASTLADWWLARRIGRSRDHGRRRAWLLASLAVNLGMLGFFKYGGFLLTNLQALLAAAGVLYEPPAWSVILPVGISFYTFASLSYTIDVYRGRYPADASLLDYALFVSFFPHLVAGPIIRAPLLLPQFRMERRASAEQLGTGLSLLAFGLFQKALADHLFAPVVDAFYSRPSEHGALDAWAAVLGFSGQIYYDFAGYSLCAIGIALCFGFQFPENFRCPYAARSFSDFWRRWHITLSSWMRDYVYISLGGGRERTWPRNLLLTMLIVGLWHGASWMFVLWGGLHGVYLVAERLLRQAMGAADPQRGGAARALAVFIVVSLTWIPFRAPDTASAAAALGALAAFERQASLGMLPVLGCFVAIGLTLLWQFRRRDDAGPAWQLPAGTVAHASAVAGCLITIFLFSGGDERSFIYFQF